MFLEDPSVTLANNAVERALRGVVARAARARALSGPRRSGAARRRAIAEPAPEDRGRTGEREHDAPGPPAACVGTSRGAAAGRTGRGDRSRRGIGACWGGAHAAGEIEIDLEICRWWIGLADDVRLHSDDMTTRTVEDRLVTNAERLRDGTIRAAHAVNFDQ
jgi:hypothetical protein